MKILLLDIETYPNLVHCWGLWDQNVSINQIITPGYTLCYAAKWYGETGWFFDSVNNSTTKKMLKGLHALLEEADAVIHYNGDRFDIPTINKDFLLLGYTPPSPAKQMDLLKTVKLKFKFPSNKLDYVSQALGVGKKAKHEGHELWIKCGQGDKTAWKTMEEYNVQDVLLLEKLYEKLIPWVKNHANYSLFNTGQLVCPHCGGNHYQKRGSYHTATSVFQRYRCVDCGTWFRDNKKLNSKAYKTQEL